MYTGLCQGAKRLEERKEEGYSKGCDTKRRYVVKVKSVMGGAGTDYEGSVTVEQNLPDPVDAGPPVGDLNRWEIPEPSQVQGLDCRSACTTGPKPDGGAQTDGGSPPPKDDDSGCAVGRPGAAAPVGLLLLGCLVLLRLRRWR